MEAFSVDYLFYKDNFFASRFFRAGAIRSRIRKIEQQGFFKVLRPGRSVEGRDIVCLSAGSGVIPVLLWSQMHGNESTATLALFDLFRFFMEKEADAGLRNLILEKCTLYFVPVLNPDGADAWTRRNAQGIDINRDLVALQSPEARVLFDLLQEIKPAFGFNLHDQESLWSVGGTKLPAVISLLAPPADAELSITPARFRAIQVISSVNKKLQEVIPGRVGRWKDEYEPRAAGEVFQQAGVATILVESGGYAGEEAKLQARKLNFFTLLHAFVQIASGDYTLEDAQSYNNIPFNSREIFHILIKNCRIETPAGWIKADIGLNYSEEQTGQTGIKVYTIADFGDLSVFNAYLVIEADELTVYTPLVLESRANLKVTDKTGEVIEFEEGICLVDLD